MDWALGNVIDMCSAAIQVFSSIAILLLNFVLHSADSLPHTSSVPSLSRDVPQSPTDASELNYAMQIDCIVS